MRKLIFVLLLLSSPLGIIFSYPRFSAYTGDKCSDCHVSPAGGGMRNTYGNNYAKQNLQMDFLKKYVKKTDFSTQLNKNISVGGDLRVFHIGNENPNTSSTNTFLTMEGDLYVNASVNDYISVHLAPGYEIPNTPAKYEVYGMVHNLSAEIYFRAGRMTPTFGVKIAEHIAYHRTRLLGAPYSMLDGVEAGLSPGIFNFSAGLYNGLGTDFISGDSKRLFVSSADVMLSSKENNVNVNLGLSFYNNPYNFIDPLTAVSNNANRQAFGGFTKIGLLKRIAIIGEVDFLEDKRYDAIKRGLFGYGELNVRIVNGVELRGQYEYMKPDRDAGSNRQTRTSVGAALFPLQGVETEAMLRFVTDDINPNTKEFNLGFHFYF
ncbi:MAG: hypothetical protein AB2L26_07360 [Ignavibacteria bacterium]